MLHLKKKVKSVWFKHQHDQHECTGLAGNSDIVILSCYSQPK